MVDSVLELGQSLPRDRRKWVVWEPKKRYQPTDITTESRSGGMADAADSKAAQPLSEPSEKQEIPAKGQVASDEERRQAPALGQSWGNQDPVEVALADALTRAAAAGQWTTVELLSRELEARRKARAQVVDIELERARRGR